MQANPRPTQIGRRDVDRLTRNTAGVALSAARLEARDKYVYRALLERADNVSADGRTLTIPDRMQPYGQHDVAMFGVSRANVQRALAHLRLHGWVTWVFKPRGSEGRPPCHYTLLVGSGCDCGPRVAHQVKPEDEAQLEASNASGKASGKASETPEFSLSVEPKTPGQDPFFPKGKEGRGSKEGNGDSTALADCAVCGTAMDLVLPRLGYRTHPCCDRDEVRDPRAA
jgi:hypothetical protein